MAGMAAVAGKEALPGMAEKFGGDMTKLGLKMPGPDADGNDPLTKLLNKAHDGGKGPSVEQLGNSLSKVGDAISKGVETGNSPGPNDLMKAVATAIKGLVTEVAHGAENVLHAGLKPPAPGGGAENSAPDPVKKFSTPFNMDMKPKPPGG